MVTRPTELARLLAEIAVTMRRHASLNPGVEIIFLASSQEYLYVSSSRLKELVQFGESVDEFVPPIVAQYLKKKLGDAG